MDPENDHVWQGLRRRVVLGESLTAVEQAAFDAGCSELDSEECLDDGLPRLRELREAIADAEVEHERLLQHQEALDARIAALESRLDDRTRQVLGITN